MLGKSKFKSSPLIKIKTNNSFFISDLMYEYYSIQNADSYDELGKLNLYLIDYHVQISSFVSTRN